MCSIGYMIVACSGMVNTMKGVYFYRDCGSPQAKNRLRHLARKDYGVVASQVTEVGNVIAMFVGKGGRTVGHWSTRGFIAETISAVFDYDNSPVASSGASIEYMQQCTIRVSEKVARQIHPEMFNYLDI
jgi:hypothetical protein